MSVRTEIQDIFQNILKDPGKDSRTITNDIAQQFLIFLTFQKIKCRMMLSFAPFIKIKSKKSL